jgi:tRNA nucleotidyltransferase/poly(A) polymerase
MRELARELLAGEEAYVVGGAVRDELLGRELVDLDIACRQPRRAARAYAARSGGAPFPLSERHGAWRVALSDGRTVDFTPLPGSILDDLATRDFTVNAIAEPLQGGEPIDPYRGRADLTARRLRAVSSKIFESDPLRLLRAVRLEDELGFQMDEETQALAHENAGRVVVAAGERILAELRRLSAPGYRRLDELGLLAPLGGSATRLDALDGEHLSPDLLLVAVFRERLADLPVSNELKRYARTLLRAEAPPDSSPRAIHRFRRSTEPWSLDALTLLGRRELADAIQAARLRDPLRPLLRGDELGLAPGPRIAELLERIEEERAAGTINTREEALDLVRRLGQGPSR